MRSLGGTRAGRMVGVRAVLRRPAERWRRAVALGRVVSLTSRSTNFLTIPSSRLPKGWHAPHLVRGGAGAIAPQSCAVPEEVPVISRSCCTKTFGRLVATPGSAI